MTRKNIHQPQESKKSENVPTLKLEPKQTPAEARVAALSKETDPEVFVPRMGLPHVFKAYEEPTAPGADAQGWVPKMDGPHEFKAVDGSSLFE